MATQKTAQCSSYNTIQGCILQRLNETLGVTVGLYHAQQTGLDTTCGPWATVCETHHTIGNHRTQALARQALSHVVWCEACQQSDRAKIARAFLQLRQQTYQVLLFVGKNRVHALQLASQWSPIGRKGSLFSTGDQKACFNQEGLLVQALEMYCEGELTVILQALAQADLRVGVTGIQEGPFSHLLVASQQTQIPIVDVKTAYEL